MLFTRTDNDNKFLPAFINYTYATDGVTITYGLTKAYSYNMAVSLNESAVLGSPFKIIITPAKADPLHTVCRGLGLRQASTNTTFSFEINLFDKFDNHLVVGGNRLYVRFFGGASFLTPHTTVPLCVDMQNGQYVCSYKALHTGPHELRIWLLNSSTTQPGGLGLTGRYYTNAKTEDANNVAWLGDEASLSDSDPHAVANR